MAGGSPRIVTADITFTWDSVTQRLTRGQVIDVQPGSPLEDAIGADNLRPLGPIAHPAAEEESPASARRAARSKASDGSDDSKDGDAS